MEEGPPAHFDPPPYQTSMPIDTRCFAEQGGLAFRPPDGGSQSEEARQPKETGEQAAAPGVVYMGYAHSRREHQPVGAGQTMDGF